VVCENAIDASRGRVQDSAYPELSDFGLYPVECGDAAQPHAKIGHCLTVPLRATIGVTRSRNVFWNTYLQ
jgi:hypothetical protein